MKSLSISKADFDDVLYPVVALDSVQDLATLRVADRVLDKLEAVADRAPQPEGVPLYVLKTDNACFELEEDEAAFVAARLEAGIPRLAASRARAIIRLVHTLR